MTLFGNICTIDSERINRKIKISKDSSCRYIIDILINTELTTIRNYLRNLKTADKLIQNRRFFLKSSRIGTFIFGLNNGEYTLINQAGISAKKTRFGKTVKINSPKVDGREIGINNVRLTLYIRDFETQTPYRT